MRSVREGSDRDKEKGVREIRVGERLGRVEQGGGRMNGGGRYKEQS